MAKKRKDLVENMKTRNDESKEIENIILQKGLEIETVHAQNLNFTNVSLTKLEVCFMCVFAGI